RPDTAIGSARPGRASSGLGISRDLRPNTFDHLRGDSTSIRRTLRAYGPPRRATLTTMSTNERIGVMGAGVMGSGIAQVMAIAGHEVVCYDVAPEALEAGRATVDTGRFGVKSAVERGKLTAEEADAALARVTFSGDLDEVANTDVIIEAVPERIDLKITVFRDLDQRAPADTILASNSSGYPIAAMAAATDRPDKVVGWHWASPAPVMKLAEIVRARATSDDTVDTVVRLAAGAGKNPIVVK